MSDNITEWLRKEAQRHSQSAGDKAFTSRRRGTFKHRAKKLLEAADALEQSQGREQQAFMAGINAVMNSMDVDEEQAWQQYRCQDDTDFRAVRGILADPASTGDTT